MSYIRVNDTNRVRRSICFDLKQNINKIVTFKLYNLTDSCRKAFWTVDIYMRYDFPTQTYTHPHRHIHTHTHLGKTLHVKDVEQYNLSAIDKEIQKYRPVLCDELFHKFIHRR